MGDRVPFAHVINSAAGLWSYPPTSLDDDDFFLCSAMISSRLLESAASAISIGQEATNARTASSTARSLSLAVSNG